MVPVFMFVNFDTIYKSYCEVREHSRRYGRSAPMPSALESDYAGAFLSKSVRRRRGSVPYMKASKGGCL